jgi:hypothetical protein
MAMSETIMGAKHKKHRKSMKLYFHFKSFGFKIILQLGQYFCSGFKINSLQL